MRNICIYFKVFFFLFVYQLVTDIFDSLFEIFVCLLIYFYFIHIFLCICFFVLQDNEEKALCVIPFITSPKEEERLIQGCVRVSLSCDASVHRLLVTMFIVHIKTIFYNSKSLLALLFSHLQPVVKLLYNRGNNKYSYTR